MRGGAGPVGLTLTVPDAALAALAGGSSAAARERGLTTEGDEGVLTVLLGVLQPGDPDFAIVEP